MEKTKEESTKYCECGCGTPVRNRFVNHHYIRLHPISKSESFRQRMCGDNNPAKRSEVAKKISENRKGKMVGSENHMKQKKYRKLFSEKFRGENNPMYGKIVSEETRQKMSKSQMEVSRKGKRKSGDMRIKLSHAKKTKRGMSMENPLWNVFIEPLTSRIRKLTEYRAWRLSVFERDKFTCQLCGTTKGKFNAHHHRSFSEILISNNIATLDLAIKCQDLWNIDNGITLCLECHKKAHAK